MRLVLLPHPPLIFSFIFFRCDSQWVSEWLIDSFRLEIAIASPSFEACSYSNPTIRLVIVLFFFKNCYNVFCFGCLSPHPLIFSLVLSFLLFFFLYFFKIATIRLVGCLSPHPLISSLVIVYLRFEMGEIKFGNSFHSILMNSIRKQKAFVVSSKWVFWSNFPDTEVSKVS